jgi:hypothetical protein
MVALNEQLAALATMSPAQLRSEWLRIFRVPPPKVTPDLLLRGAAYRIQERAFGGFSAAERRKLAGLEHRLEQQNDSNAAADIVIKPGTRLVRDWGGVSHHVLILEQGYLYRDQRFESLSHLARHITGAKWSGPRFFGLVGRTREKANA